MLIRRSPLDPLPRVHPPRPSTVVRMGLAAVLLCLAAAALYAEPAAAPAPALGPASPVASGGPRLPEGMLGVPIRLAEPVAAAAVRPGDRVDLLALPGGVVLATGALVLVSTGEGEALVLALNEAQARSVVVAGPQARFGVILRARPDEEQTGR